MGNRMRHDGNNIAFTASRAIRAGQVRDGIGMMQRRSPRLLDHLNEAFGVSNGKRKMRAGEGILITPPALTIVRYRREEQLGCETWFVFMSAPLSGPSYVFAWSSWARNISHEQSASNEVNHCLKCQPAVPSSYLGESVIASS